MVKLILKIVLPLVVLAGGIVGTHALIAGAPEPEPRPKQDHRPTVDTVVVVKETRRLDVEAYGFVQPRTEITLAPQVSGRVDRISPALKSGGFFRKGEVLLHIEPRDFELAVTQAKARIARAGALLDRERAEAEIARKEWERFGAGKANPLVLRKPQLAEAEAELASAEAGLAVAELNLERTTIRAPFAGRVRSVRVDEGQFLTTGTPVATVISTDHAEVRLAVPVDRIAFLDLPLDTSVGHEESGSGLAISLVATFQDRQYTWQGRIVRTEAEIDVRSRVVHAIARVKNPFAKRMPGQPPLLMGMYVRATIPGRVAADVAVLPRSLLHGRDQVVVVDENDRLHLRKVTVRRRCGEEVIISSGLEKGERICATQVDPLVEGMAVLVKEEENAR